MQPVVNAGVVDDELSETAKWSGMKRPTLRTEEVILRSVVVEPSLASTVAKLLSVEAETAVKAGVLR